MPEQLIVVKRLDYYLVAYDQAGEDWVARFEVDGVFPAEEWAYRMAFLNNSYDDERYCCQADGYPDLLDS